MKNKVLAVILFLVFASTIVFAVSSMTKEQKGFFNGCKKNCSTQKMMETRQCNNVSFDCGKDCKEARDACTLQYRADLANCSEQCIQLNNSVRHCRKNCSASLEGVRMGCNKGHLTCKQSCQEQKNACKKAVNEHAEQCKGACELNAMNYSTNSSDLEKVFCPRIRPKNCVETNEPVCSNKNITYTNGCFACAIKSNSWYVQGAC